MPRISVVILSYNFEKYLSECIDSILAQTLKPYEIILCDDCSNDNSWSIIKSYQDKYSNIIRSYRHEENMGPFYNGTFGGKVYKGDFICIMDGDDRWLPQKLQKEWKALQNNRGAQIAYSGVNLINENGAYIKSWNEGKENKPPSGDVLVDVYSKGFFRNTKSVFRNELVTHHAFQKEGHCDENLKSYWDWERKIRYAARFPIAYSGETLVEYRKYDDSFSANSPDIHFKAFIQVYEKHLQLLENRSLEERTRVQVRLESIIALNQYRLFGSNFDNQYSIDAVFHRNLQLFRKLPKNARTVFIGNNYKILDKLTKYLVKDKISKDYLFRAFWYQFMFSNCNFNMPKSMSIALFKIIKHIFKNHKKSKHKHNT